jgi:hypothetical protein
VALIRPISRDWHRSLVGMVRGAKKHLLVCSPFVGYEGTRVVIENVPTAFIGAGRVTFLTNLSVVNLCQVSTDPRAIKKLVDFLPRSDVVHLPGLHAKVYVADNERAIVTSGNLTAGGLYRNLEYGIEVSDPIIVRRIRKELTDFASLGVSVPQPRLAAYCDVVNELFESLRDAQRAAQSAVRKQFRQSLVEIEDDLIRLRLNSGPIHAIFAGTIEYVLRMNGPLTTIQIHPMISAIHPDLCDDSIDRVIDGKRFGKKWKHAARTAQQQLKRQGKIIYDNGAWRIA